MCGFTVNLKRVAFDFPSLFLVFSKLIDRAALVCGLVLFTESDRERSNTADRTTIPDVEKGIGMFPFS